MLQSMCGNPRCKAKDQSKCKADALVLANAIQDVWKNAPAGRYTDKKDNVRGFMCGKWAHGFAFAGVVMEARNSVTGWSRDYREWHEYEFGDRFHMGTRFTPAGADPKCCGITVDDGFLSEGTVHDPSWKAAGWHETSADLPMSNGKYGPTQNPWRNLHP